MACLPPHFFGNIKDWATMAYLQDESLINLSWPPDDLLSWSCVGAPLSSICHVGTAS